MSSFGGLAVVSRTYRILFALMLSGVLSLFAIVLLPFSALSIFVSFLLFAALVLYVYRYPWLDSVLGGELRLS